MEEVVKRTIVNFLIVIVFIVGLLFATIYIEGDEDIFSQYFSSVEKKARIISINENTCIVRFTDGDGVDISIPVSELEKYDSYNPGDYLMIEYSGDILETSPARLENVIRVTLSSR